METQTTQIKNSKRSRFLVAALVFWIAYDIQVVARMIWGYRHPDPSAPGFLHEHLLHYQNWAIWKYSFFVHAAVGSLLLASGLFSFLIVFRKFPRSIHRALGKTYVASVLIFAAPTGFVMAFFARSWITQLNFAWLALLWFWVTYRGYQLAKKQRFREHAILMTLSFGLSCAALMQRRISFWGSMTQFLFDLDPSEHLYEIASVGGWTLTTLISLALIRMIFRISPKNVLILLRPNYDAPLNKKRATTLKGYVSLDS